MRQKRITTIIMASAMVLALMGCGNGSAADPEEISTEMTQADPSFEYNGKTVSFMDDAQTVVDALKSVAENVNEVEADGGKTFDFEDSEGGYNLTVVTSTEGGSEIVGSVSANGSGFKTSKGIGIGSTAEEVKAAYGKPNEKDKFKKGELDIYRCEGFSFSFNIKDGKVESILYSNSNFHG